LVGSLRPVVETHDECSSCGTSTVVSGMGGSLRPGVETHDQRFPLGTSTFVSGVGGSLRPDVATHDQRSSFGTATRVYALEVSRHARCGNCMGMLCRPTYGLAHLTEDRLFPEEGRVKHINYRYNSPAWCELRGQQLVGQAL